jgi:hypothetical protein
MARMAFLGLGLSASSISKKFIGYGCLSAPLLIYLFDKKGAA